MVSKLFGKHHLIASIGLPSTAKVKNFFRNIYIYEPQIKFKDISIFILQVERTSSKMFQILSMSVNVECFESWRIFFFQTGKIYSPFALNIHIQLETLILVKMATSTVRQMEIFLWNAKFDWIWKIGLKTRPIIL